ncbi:MAG: PIN domain-containing protein, partial [Planctomycetes bacterium]|nr:PIN domain-containing protein [Planctomycetota bacterium]
IDRTEKHKTNEDQFQTADLLRFFDNDYIHLIRVDRKLATEAAKIARAHRVKPPDAIHLATALLRDCQIIHTYDDKKLLKLDGKVGEPPLTIIEPTAEIQANLFPEGEKE